MPPIYWHWVTYVVLLILSQDKKDTFLLFIQQADGKVTDFLSFYTLPSSIMHHPLHKELKAAYAFYNVSTKTPMEDLMQAALILAKQVWSWFGLALWEHEKVLSWSNIGLNGVRHPGTRAMNLSVACRLSLKTEIFQYIERKRWFR